MRSVWSVFSCPLAEQVQEYWERYGVPCMLSETNIRGFASDRVTWLKYTLEQCERAAAAGSLMQADRIVPREVGLTGLQ